jgi:hypothetical protein
MRPVRQLYAPLALLLAAIPAAARGEVHEDEWVSYRDAYRAMVVFEKYGGPKNLLVSQLQVSPRDRSADADGLELALAGRSGQVNLPLDALGRTVLPLQKAAYDDNSVLVLNRRADAFVLRPRVSIAVRADGVYDAAELHAACAQALAFARWVDASVRTRHCAGVRFVFPKKGGGRGHVHRGDGPVSVRRGTGAEQGLPAATGPAFTGEEDEGFPTVTWRFGAPGEHAQVLTYNAPLAIVPVFE